MKRTLEPLTLYVNRGRFWTVSFWAAAGVNRPFLNQSSEQS